jgi:hypothetical protein
VYSTVDVLRQRYWAQRARLYRSLGRLGNEEFAGNILRLSGAFVQLFKLGHSTRLRRLFAPSAMPRGILSAMGMLQQLRLLLWTQRRSNIWRASIAKAIRANVTVRAIQPTRRCRTALLGNKARWRLHPLCHRQREMRCPAGSLFTSRTSRRMYTHATA